MQCLQGKAPHIPERAAMGSLNASQPMELVCIDYLGLEESKGKYANILVITDVFTKYAWAIPTRNQFATTTARVLFDNFLVHYGFPLRLHSDQGRKLKEISSLNCVNLLEYESLGLHHTILWEMLLPNDLTEPFSTCYVLYLMTRKLTGSPISLALYIPTMPQSMIPLGFVLSI